MDFSILVMASASCCLVVGLAAFFLWGANKGYDITDEAIFFLQAERPHDVKCYPFFDFYYSAWLYRLTKGSIIIHRVALVVAEIIAGIIFSYGAVAFLKASFPEAIPNLHQQLFVYNFLLICSLAQHSDGPRLLYYNNLNGLLLLTSTGLLLTACFGGVARPEYFVLAAGYVVGIQLFVKISSYLTNLTVLGVLWLVSSMLYPQQCITYIGFFTAGLCASTAAHFIFLQSPRRWWQAFSLQLKMAKIFDWGVQCIPRHQRELRDYAILLFSGNLYFYGIIGLIVGAAFAFRMIDHTVAAIILCGVFYEIFRREWPRGPLKNQAPLDQNLSLLVGRFLAPLVVVSGTSFLLGMATGSHLPLHDGHLHVSAVFIYLVGLPFIGAIGTGRAIYQNLIFQIAGWGLVVLAASFQLAQQFQTPAIAFFIAGCLEISIAAQTALRFFYRSYRLFGSLGDCKHLTRIGAGGVRIKLEKTAKEYFDDVRQLMEANGFKKGDDIIGLFDCPGIVHMLGGISPGHQWYYTLRDMENTMKANHYHLAQVEESRRKRAFIVEHGSTEIFHPYLKQLGMNFPQDYQLVGKLFWPESKRITSIWKPQDKAQSADHSQLWEKIEKAKIELAGGNFEAAICLIKDTLRYRPDIPVLRIDLANLLLSARDWSAAEAQFRIAIASGADFEGTIGLSKVALRKSNLGEAISYSNQALTLRPRDPEALKWRAILALYAGDALLARSTFERVLERNGSDIEALRGLIAVEEACGQHDRAQTLRGQLQAVGA